MFFSPLLIYRLPFSEPVSIYLQIKKSHELWQHMYKIIPYIKSSQDLDTEAMNQSQKFFLFDKIYDGANLSQRKQ